MASPGMASGSDDLLDRARKPTSPHDERIGRGHADDERHEERCARHEKRAPYRFRIEIPDLDHPLQGDTRRDATEVIYGNARKHREDRRDDQKRGNDQRE